MQPNEITLAVDEENDGVGLVNAVFTRFEAPPNRSLYIGENHALNARDTLGMYRTIPKPNGNFRGVAKTAVKFTMDTVVDGVDGVSQLTSPIIFELSCSLPVGVTSAQAKVMRQRMIALLDRDDIMGPLHDQQLV